MTAEDKKTSNTIGAGGGDHNGKVPTVPPVVAEAASPQEAPISRYLKTSFGGRFLASEVAIMNTRGFKLYVKNRYGDILHFEEFEDEEGAVAELDLLTQQLDRYETVFGKEARPQVAAPRGHYSRRR